MNMYYIAGFPISDELYHHGIIGQKWGVRRYQNSDGTLTAEGKVRYHMTDKSSVSKGSSVLSKAIGSISNTVKAYRKHLAMRFKKKHPWLMSDEELNRVVTRMTAEKRLRELKADEDASRFINRTMSTIGDITLDNVKTFNRSFFNRSGGLIAEYMFGDDKEGQKDKKEKREKRERQKDDHD